MSPLRFLGRVKLSDLAGQFTLSPYIPELTLRGHVAGVDNLRPDVFLSAKFTERARVHLASLIEQHGEVQQLARVPEENPFGDSPYGRAHIKGDALPKQETDHSAEFRKALIGLQTASLRRARQADELQLDLLCRLAILKFLRSELAVQFAKVQDRCRDNLRKRAERHQAQHEMVLRDRFLRFQVNKRQVLRRVGDDVLSTLAEVERDTVAGMRHSLFGDREVGYDILDNRLLFPDSVNDPFVRATNYALFGSFDRDRDHFAQVTQLGKNFLNSLGLAQSDSEAEALLNNPENAKMLMFSGIADESPRARAQKAITSAWVDALEEAGVLEHAMAAYETAPIIEEYAVVSPQQLKCALIMKHELRRVEEVLESHNQRSRDKLRNAAHRVRSAGNTERLRYAARYFIDLSRFHRDVQKLEVLERALDAINLLNNDRLRQLSEINGTLYEYLLPEEEGPQEQRVKDHIVLKADIRDSTLLTRSLLERGLNPASFFSLNFFEPVNKLLPKYGAEKVFIEGDAVILTLLENEGQRGFGVARTCVMAREMLNIVRAYNQASVQSGLPPLEIGTGIAYQSSPPLYLMDGNHRVMISEALNLSDRLSACHKRARHYLRGRNLLFSVFVFQTADEESAAGALEDFLLNYNVGGIHLPKAAFEKMQNEISLEEFEMELPMPWGSDRVTLYRGLVPVSPGVFHPILIRKGRTAQVEVRDFEFVRWADHIYYEVCSNEDLIAKVEGQRPN